MSDLQDQAILQEIELELDENYLDGVFSLCHFKNTGIQRIIVEIKFKSRVGLGVTLGGLVKHQIVKFASGKVVCPIPIHTKRNRVRGFNQAEKILDGADLKYTKLIIRMKNTKPNSDLKRHDRFKNIQNAFQINLGMKELPDEVILFDDVCTTGATFNEAAKVLKLHGVQKVYGLAIAHD